MTIEFQREILPLIKQRLFEPGKIIILYGPRQVGKTTLSKQILHEYDSDNGYFNCETQIVESTLQSKDPTTMFRTFGGHKVIVFDEAQTILNIGKALKLLIDTYPEMSIIATGSSSFDLANKIAEPLTGRHWSYFLFPISFNELIQLRGNREVFESLNQVMIYGSYPEVLTTRTSLDAQLLLNELATDYAYRDLFKYKDIQNPQVLTDILRALSLQVGNEVSLNELARLVGVDKKTVSSYINLLEQAFIIFHLSPYNTNQRKEIKRPKKYYFYDNGMMSAFGGGFSEVDNRLNIGAQWENLMIAERKKYNQRKQNICANYFWRLQNSGEVDYVEISNQILHPYEFKWNKDKAKRSSYNFNKLYPNAEPLQIINNHNFFDFVI